MDNLGYLIGGILLLVIGGLLILFRGPVSRWYGSVNRAFYGKRVGNAASTVSSPGWVIAAGIFALAIGAFLLVMAGLAASG